MQRMLIKFRGSKKALRFQSETLEAIFYRHLRAPPGGLFKTPPIFPLDQLPETPTQPIRFNACSVL